MKLAVRNRIQILIVILFVLLVWQQSFTQLRISLDSFHFILNYLLNLIFDTGIVTLYLLLHNVVAVLVFELIDDRNLLVCLCLCIDLCTIHDDA